MLDIVAVCDGFVPSWRSFVWAHPLRGRHPPGSLIARPCGLLGKAQPHPVGLRGRAALYSNFRSYSSPS